jgi:hypothetical protein
MGNEMENIGVGTKGKGSSQASNPLDKYVAGDR